MGACSFQDARLLFLLIFPGSTLIPELRVSKYKYCCNNVTDETLKEISIQMMSMKMLKFSHLFNLSIRTLLISKSCLQSFNKCNIFAIVFQGAHLIEKVSMLAWTTRKSNKLFETLGSFIAKADVTAFVVE